MDIKDVNFEFRQDFVKGQHCKAIHVPSGLYTEATDLKSRARAKNQAVRTLAAKVRQWEVKRGISG